MVSVTKSFGDALSLSSQSPLSQSLTQVQISRDSIPPASEIQTSTLVSVATSSVKVQTFDVEDLRNRFFEAHEVIKKIWAEPPYFTKEKCDILQKPELERKHCAAEIWNSMIKEGVSVEQFLLQDKSNATIMHYLITREIVPKGQITQKDRIATALAYIKIKGEIGQSIYQYEIEDSVWRVKLCIESLRVSFEDTFHHRIPEFYLTNKGLIEIYKFVIAFRPDEAPDFSFHFQNVKDKADLLEIAKIHAASFTSFQRIYDWAQQSTIGWTESDCLEVLNVAFKHYPLEYLKQIHSYPTEPFDYSYFPIARAKVLKLGAKYVTSGINEFIVKYKVDKEEDLIEIYKICLFHAYHITHKEELQLLDALFAQIIKFRSPQSRKVIADSLHHFLSPAFFIQWCKLVKGNSKKASVHTMIPAALTMFCVGDTVRAMMIDYSKSPEAKGILSSLMKYIRKERDNFRNAQKPHLHLFVNFLLELEKSELSFADKVRALSQIYVDGDIASRLRALTTFLYMKKSEEITKDKPIPNEALNKMFHALMCETFQLEGDKFGGIDNFNKLYFERIENKFRDKDALLVYAGKLNALLFDDEKDAILKAYSAFVNSLLKNEYYQLRNQSPQMIEISKLKGSESVIKVWNDPPPFEPMNNYIGSDKNEIVEIISFPQQFKKFLTDKLKIDNHIEDLKKRLPYLYDLLNKEKGIESLQKELSIEKDSLLIDLQKCCLNFLQSKDKDDKLLEQLGEILKVLMSEEPKIWDEFARDVTSFSNSFKSVKGGNMTIGITNDPCDMLLLGRETGGCQSIDGSPNYNKCALAYVIDGKNSAVVIKGEDGRIKARAILRLLIDETNKNPVLFLERHYSSSSDANFGRALNNYAINFAKKMGLYLVTSHALEREFGCKKYGPIVSVGSNAPFEYTDAGGGRTNGAFTIPESYVMYEPQVTISL